MVTSIANPSRLSFGQNPQADREATYNQPKARRIAGQGKPERLFVTFTHKGVGDSRNAGDPSAKVAACL